MSGTPVIEFAYGDWPTLVASFTRAAQRSPFVRKQIERSGATLAELTADPERWRDLTPTSKQDLIEDQQRRPPFGERLCVAENEIGLIVESSGSTGRGREVHYTSKADTETIAARWGGYLRKIGVHPGELIALTLPIGMAGGGVRHWSAYGAAGANVLRMGGLSSTRKLEAIDYYGITTLVATPAYVDHLAMVARESSKSPGDIGIRRIAVATQSVSVDWIRATEQEWGAKLFEWYATSAGFACFTCEQGMLAADGKRGTLHWDPTLNVHEIADPKTGQWVSSRCRGEVIGTPLVGEAEALFRMRSGDEAQFRAPGSCVCGSPWPGIESGTVRRLDDMLKVKGINIWPPKVDAAVLDLDGVLDYRVVVWTDERRAERARLDVLAHPGDHEQLRAKVASSIHAETGVSFDVTVVGEVREWSQQASGEAGKVKRWVDERDQADRR